MVTRDIPQLITDTFPEAVDFMLKFWSSHLVFDGDSSLKYESEKSFLLMKK